MSNKEKKPYAGIIPKSERTSYYLGALGQGMMYSMMSGYISDFYMNIMGLSFMFVLWLTLLSRYPTEEELQVVMDNFRQSGRQNPGKMQDLIWSLLNTKEFLCKH